MNSARSENIDMWIDSSATKLVLAISIIVLIAVSFDGLAQMVHSWGAQEEYSHGYLIPFICAYLLWQKRIELKQMQFGGSWLALGVVVPGVLVLLLGVVSSTHVLIQYGFVLSLIGIIYSYTGWVAFRSIAVPLLFLFFMIPLPGIIFFRLSSELQLISSQLGVAVIRLFGISVFLEGNVIDLGTYKLQVVEACSGLRYLFPLMSLAFIAVYFFRVSVWKRAIVFLSSIPITIFMNSFRIGVIGVLVENWGSKQAEGFLHDFEGWVVFMFSLGLLFSEMWLFNHFSKERKSFSDVFGLSEVNTSSQITDNTNVNIRRFSKPLISTSIAVIVLAIALSILHQRETVHLARKDFSAFPMQMGEWKGKKSDLEKIYLDILRLDDYILADYIKQDTDYVNLYMAYYGKQEVGGAAHSPKACIPGGGWLIEDVSEITVNNVMPAGGSFKANRLIIKKGQYSQIVYYWFQQRGRIIASEYDVKWYMFKDALSRNRTDGALVRLTTLIKPGESIAAGDSRIRDLTKEIFPFLDSYIPK